VTGERAPHSARPAGNRAADRRRRLDAVLDAAARAASLVDLLQVTLAALDEHLGYARSAFMLAVAEPPLSGRRAYAGVTHGSPEYMLEEYFERWADRDPTRPPARSSATAERGSRTSTSYSTGRDACSSTTSCAGRTRSMSSRTACRWPGRTRT
jgi:hypothetical protein